MRAITSVLTATLLLLTACGDDDSGGGGGGSDRSSADQEYVDAAMANFDPEEAEPLTEDDARCVVESLVDPLGADRLEELGIQPEDFGSQGDNPFPEGMEEDEANEIVDGLDSCLDLSALFIDGISQDSSIDDETKACLEDAFDPETIRKIFVTIFVSGEDALQDDEELTTALTGIFSECPGAVSG